MPYFNCPKCLRAHNADGTWAHWPSCPDAPRPKPVLKIARTAWIHSYESMRGRGESSGQLVLVDDLGHKHRLVFSIPKEVYAFAELLESGPCGHLLNQPFRITIEAV